MPPQPSDQPEGHQTIKDWFANGQRVSCRVYQSLLDSEGRPEFVSCHLIEDLVRSNASESGVPLPSHSSINGSTKEEEGGGRDAVNQMECVTFVHGYPTCSYDYYPVVKHILKGRRLKCKLLLVDMLGYGDSDKGVGQARFSVQQHANVLQCIWDRYDIKSSHLVVHDFAVSVAQELLYRQPKSRLSIDLGKIFWLNGSVFIDLYRPTSLQKMLCAPTGWLTAQLMSQATLAESIKQEFSKEHPPSKQMLADIYTALCNRDGQKIHHKLVRFMKDRRRYKYVWQGALELAMRQDPQRMMFYWGMQDPLSGAHVAAELRRRYSKYSVNIVERKDLGHWPHLEDPEGVADALVDFLLDPAYQPKYVKHAPADGSDSIYRVSISFGQMHTYGYCPSSFRRKSSMERSQSGTRAIAVTGDEGGSVRHTPNLPSLPDLSAIEEASQTVEASHTADTPKREAKSEVGVNGNGTQREGTNGVAAGGVTATVQAGGDN